MGSALGGRPHHQGLPARRSSLVLVEDSGNPLSFFTVTATSFMSILIQFSYALGAGREICHCSCYISQGFPSLTILGNPPSTPLQAVPVPLAGIPYSHLPWAPGMLWAAVLAVCLSCPFLANDLFGLPPELYSVPLPTSLFLLCQPLLSPAGPVCPPPPTAALMAPGRGLDLRCSLGLSPVMFMFSLHCPKW